MPEAKTGVRNDRTKRDIKRALIELLESKSLDSITMSELARKAQVSRSTLYQHYGNVHDVYADTIEDFRSEVSPIMNAAACFDGIEPVGMKSFCDLVRDERHDAVTNTRDFLNTFINNEMFGNPVFHQELVSAGYTPQIARALAYFQMNGCFNAAKRYGCDDETWHEVREAIDTFICGGLAACKERKAHQLAHKQMNPRKKS